MIDKLKSFWESFFFREVRDDRIFVLIRVFVAVVLLLYAGVLAPNWIRWFGESGVLNLASAKANIDSDTWSILNWVPGTPPVLWTVFTIFLIQTVLLLLGIAPRIQVICLFLWVVSFHHRNNLIWEGGDVLLRIILFLMIFMPLRSGSQSKRSGLWSLRLLQLQQSVLYFSTVGRKLQGEDWINGHALYYASKLSDFSGRILTLRISSPELLWIYQVGTWTALAVEMLLVFGVWVPSIRKQVVLIGITFHIVIEFSMNLFVFQWLMILVLATHLFTGPSRLNPVESSTKPS